MIRLVRRSVALAAGAAVTAGGLLFASSGGGSYTATIVFPVATNLHTGGAVDIQGFQVGNVAHLGVRNGQAMVTVAIDRRYAPLHAGTKASIDYRSLLGERYVELTPGPKTNPVIPDGGILQGGENRVEISALVSQLGPATRAQLVSLIPQLQTLLAGPNTANVQQTITEAAPAVQALGQILAAVGQDGLALHQLVAGMANLSSRLVQRQNDVAGTVQGLDQAFSAVARQQSSLTSALSQLPATLTAARQTVGLLPATTATVLPLLQDLQPVSASLPSFSAKLQPVLSQLQPVSSLLVPTLGGLANLLRGTPALLGSLNATLPLVTQAAYPLEPVASFLRPYTPELAGFVTNWANWLSNYNQAGNFLRGQVPVGTTSVAGFQVGGITVPGGVSETGRNSLELTQVPDPPPGYINGSAPTDAAGSAIQAGNGFAQGASSIAGSSGGQP